MLREQGLRSFWRIFGWFVAATARRSGESGLRALRPLVESAVFRSSAIARRRGLSEGCVSRNGFEVSKISKAKNGSFSDLGERPKKHSTTTRKVVELSRQSIEAKALKYLNQYDASAVRLRRVLVDFVKRTAAATAVDPANYLQMVNETLDRYQQNGLLNDRRYGETMARGLMERGSSRRAIQAKLQGRGISGQVIDEVFAELQTSANSELVSARALVRKRKLGNYRPEAERRENYQRDLGVLARAGFDFETAKRALSVEGATEEGEF